MNGGPSGSSPDFFDVNSWLSLSMQVVPSLCPRRLQLEGRVVDRDRKMLGDARLQGPGDLRGMPIVKAFGPDNNVRSQYG